MANKKKKKSMRKSKSKKKTAPAKKKMTARKQKSARARKPAKKKILQKQKKQKKQTKHPKSSKGTGSPAFASPQRGVGRGRQAGDLQGLSNSERADSESVDELLEEGNAFEAGVVQGVQDADDADESEVHTHEVPEDDVPGEYLDKD